MSAELQNALLKYISAVQSAICNLVPVALMDNVARDRVNNLIENSDDLAAAVKSERID
jgi:hypothetical protein